MLRVAEHFKRTDPGRQREINEDSYFVRAPLFVVADGMGGAQAGEVASQLAVEAFEDGLPDGTGTPEERLVGLVQEANSRIYAQSRTDDERAGMGTTVTAAYVDAEEVAVAHVGDSRFYCLRDGELVRRTEDHTLVEELVREGRLTPEEADEHPQRSIITRALGPEADVVVDHHTWRGQPDDVYLLCSDGLTSMVPEAEIGEIMRSSPSLRDTGLRLVEAANAAGGRDNITVILFRLEEVDGPAVADQPTGALEVERPAQTVARRQPVAPRPPQARKRIRRPGPGAALAWLTIVGLVVAVVGTAGFFASQSVYFVGVDDTGFVTLYRGMPYDLPAGMHLYTRRYTSGVTASGLAPRLRRTVTDHKLRSRDDAVDLVRQLELGKLTGQ